VFVVVLRYLYMVLLDMYVEDEYREALYDDILTPE
jgi:hypothetical protein